MYFPAGFFFLSAYRNPLHSELFWDVKDDVAFDVLIRVMQKEVPSRKPVGYGEEGVRMLKK